MTNISDYRVEWWCRLTESWRIWSEHATEQAAQSDLQRQERLRLSGSGNVYRVTGGVA